VSLDDALARYDAVAGGRPHLAQAQVSLGPLSTYRVGGPAARYALAETEEDLHLVAQAVMASDLPVLVVGKGSNLLVADVGFAGVAIQLGAGFAEVEIEGTQVRAGGAASLPVVARRTAAAGLTGFEWAVGVPGSIGGAVRMNAGGHGSDMAASLVRVRVVDLAGGEDGEVSTRALGLQYRSSAVTSSQVVVSAELQLRGGIVADAEAEIADIVRWRRAHQPGGQNAGSVFTNPPGSSAGALIDAAGLKGLRHGGAEVSPKHANFIQAADGGSADDVWNLMVDVRQRVFDHAGVLLHPETRMVGFDELPDPRDAAGPS